MTMSQLDISPAGGAPLMGAIIRGCTRDAPLEWRPPKH